MTVLEHPPYSPDLAPCDYFLFPRLKKELRGVRFASVDALQAEVNHVLKEIPVHEYRAAMLDLPRRWRKCMQEGGDYFEGMRKLRPDNPVVQQGDQ